MNAKEKKSNNFTLFREIEDQRRAEEIEKNEIYNKRIYRSPTKEDYEKTEESNKIYNSDKDIDGEKQRLEEELKEKQDRLKKLIREKNIIERNLEEKYDKELKSKKNLTVTLSFILVLLIAIFLIQSFYL